MIWAPSPCQIEPITTTVLERSHLDQRRYKTWWSATRSRTISRRTQLPHPTLHSGRREWCDIHYPELTSPPWILNSNPSVPTRPNPKERVFLSPMIDLTDMTIPWVAFTPSTDVAYCDRSRLERSEMVLVDEGLRDVITLVLNPLMGSKQISSDPMTKWPLVCDIIHMQMVSVLINHSHEASVITWVNELTWRPSVQHCEGSCLVLAERSNTTIKFMCIRPITRGEPVTRFLKDAVRCPEDPIFPSTNNTPKNIPHCVSVACKYLSHWLQASSPILPHVLKRSLSAYPNSYEMIYCGMNQNSLKYG